MEFHLTTQQLKNMRRAQLGEILNLIVQLYNLMVNRSSPRMVKILTLISREVLKNRVNW
jgi:hypothetical protein